FSGSVEQEGNEGDWLVNSFKKHPHHPLQYCISSGKWYARKRNLNRKKAIGLNAYKRSTTPLFIMGFLFLVLFAVIGFGVHAQQAWVDTFDMFWIDRVQAYVAPAMTAFIKFIT